MIAKISKKRNRLLIALAGLVLIGSMVFVLLPKLEGNVREEPVLNYSKTEDILKDELTLSDSKAYSIAAGLNREYGCEGTVNDLLRSDKSHYLYKTDKCEISIGYEYELNEVSSYVNSKTRYIDTVISYFNRDDLKFIATYYPKDDIFSFSIDEEKYHDSNEISNASVNQHYSWLKKYSDDIVNVNLNNKEWNYDIVLVREEPEDTGTHFLRAAMTGREEEPVTVYKGEITIPLSYSLTNYRREDIEDCINKAIGKRIYINGYGYLRLDRITSNLIISSILKDEEALSLLDNTGTNSFSLNNLYWIHSGVILPELFKLEYSDGWGGGAPLNERQCTQFAATYFYERYGFAALRGDGNMHAVNLLRDCGRDSSCPVKFEETEEPRSGSIVSLYPNHVAIVDEVGDDGTVYISEGNIYDEYGNDGIVNIRKAYSSLDEYCSYMHTTVRIIASPIEE